MLAVSLRRACPIIVLLSKLHDASTTLCALESKRGLRLRRGLLHAFKRREDDAGSQQRQGLERSGFRNPAFVTVGDGSVLETSRGGSLDVPVKIARGEGLEGEGLPRVAAGAHLAGVGAARRPRGRRAARGTEQAGGKIVRSVEA